VDVPVVRVDLVDIEKGHQASDPAGSLAAASGSDGEGCAAPLPS
jgi:hypothetical protein